MTNKIHVKNITIQLGDKKSITLTIEEAKELYEQLSGLFGERVQYVPSAPIYIEREKLPWWEPYRVTWCHNDSVTAESDAVRVTYSGDNP